MALTEPATATPLAIGPMTIDPPVVLAPMAGVTNAPFRRLCRQFGAGLYVSEMISARAVVERDTKTMRMLRFGDDERIRSVQLYGVDPGVVAAATTFIVDAIGVHHLDLNFGCPAGKVTKKGGGAALPVRRALFRSIVRAAVRAAGKASVPVTVKLRIGVDAEHVTAFEAGTIAEAEGAAAVSLHARTAEQLYSGTADWTAITALKAAVTTIPVLGNGDIWEAEDALRMMAETGCDGVVVGRGCLGRPWLFRDLADALAGRPLEAPPALGEVMDMMRTHLALLCDAMGPTHGPIDFRKHVSWYLTGFPIGGERRRALGQISSAAEMDVFLDQLDPSIPFPDDARRAARGHTGGPRKVALPPRWFDAVDDPTPPEGADRAVSGG